MPPASPSTTAAVSLDHGGVQDGFVDVGITDTPAGGRASRLTPKLLRR